jgi:hypothetical protein
MMFGVGFEDCWYKVLGVLGLELSGDLRFRGAQNFGRLATTTTGGPMPSPGRSSATSQAGRPDGPG